MKSFRPEKLITTNRSNATFREQNDGNNLNIKISAQGIKVKHNFVSKLVAYNLEGISILEVNMISLKKLERSK